jgi:hypothetical protein
MSIENIISSLQDCQIAQCTFAGSMKTYSYKVQKAWNVADGDVLVVDAPSSGLTIVQVMKVVEGEIDITADFNYKWAVGKVDLESYQEQLAKEAEAAVELKALRRKAQQKKALADLLGDLGEEANEVIERVRSRL